MKNFFPRCQIATVQKKGTIVKKIARPKRTLEKQALLLRKKKGIKKPQNHLRLLRRRMIAKRIFVKRKNRIVYFVAASAFAFVRFLDDEER